MDVSTIEEDLLNSVPKTNIVDISVLAGLGYVVFQYPSVITDILAATALALYLLVRWIRGSSRRRAISQARVEAAYTNRPTLLAHLQGITSKIQADAMSPEELVLASEWWLEEEMVPYHQRRPEDATTGQRVSAEETRRLRRLQRLEQGANRVRFRAIARGEALAAHQLNIVNDIVRIGYDAYARLVVDRAIEEGFLTEELVQEGNRWEIRYLLAMPPPAA